LLHFPRRFPQAAISRFHCFPQLRQRAQKERSAARDPGEKLFNINKMRKK
jgi:hypothetical protein